MTPSQIEHYVGRLLPNWYPINALLIAPHFYRRFRRIQRRPSSLKANYHDFMVDRMARNRWSELHLRCVDKETAKEEAKRLAPAVRIPRTQEIVQTPRGISKTYLQERIGRYVGQHYVAKPTNGSGAVLFLDNFTDADFEMLFRATRYNQFYSFRETNTVTYPRRSLLKTIWLGLGTIYWITNSFVLMELSCSFRSTSFASPITGGCYWPALQMRRCQSN